jgi:hypothetical protein
MVCLLRGTSPVTVHVIRTLARPVNRCRTLNYAQRGPSHLRSSDAWGRIAPSTIKPRGPSRSRCCWHVNDLPRSRSGPHTTTPTSISRPSRNHGVPKMSKEKVMSTRVTRPGLCVIRPMFYQLNYYPLRDRRDSNPRPSVLLVGTVDVGGQDGGRGWNRTNCFACRITRVSLPCGAGREGKPDLLFSKATLCGLCPTGGRLCQEILKDPSPERLFTPTSYSTPRWRARTRCDFLRDGSPGGTRTHDSQHVELVH